MRLRFRREAVPVFLCWWAVLLILFTEALSALHQLARWPLLLCWTAACILAVVARPRLPRLLGSGFHNPAVPGTPGRHRLWNLRDRLAVAAILAIWAVEGLIAWFSPPNGYDVDLYHMPRVVIWASQRSAAFFPANYYALLSNPPLAEWFILHGYILTGSDRWANLVQWLFAGACFLVVSLIARDLGGGRWGQILAAFLVATLHQGILAASNAKNDWASAFWISSSVWFFLRWRRDPNLLTSAYLGVAVGAALLTKGTAYPILLPLAGVIVILLLSPGRKGRLRTVPLILLIILAANAWQWNGNRKLSGSILGPASPDAQGLFGYAVQHPTPRRTLVNAMMHLSMHLGTPVASLNHLTADAVRAVSGVLGVSPEDPTIAKPITPGARAPLYQYFIPKYGQDEYLAGNPLHLLLILALTVAGVLAFRKRDPAPVVLLLGCGVAFLAFCSSVRWLPQCARLHHPIFVVACAGAAVIAEREPRWARLTAGIAALLLCASVPPLFFNALRPLVVGGLHSFRHVSKDRQSIILRTRTELYFAQPEYTEAAYAAAAAYLEPGACARLDIDNTLNPYTYEYPLMALLRTRGKERSFRYRGTENLTTQFERGPVRDGCAVLCFACRGNGAKLDLYSARYPHTAGFGDLVVFTVSPQPGTGPPR